MKDNQFTPLTNTKEAQSYIQAILENKCFKVTSTSKDDKLDPTNHNFSDFNIYINPKKGDYSYFVISPIYENEEAKNQHYKRWLKNAKENITINKKINAYRFYDFEKRNALKKTRPEAIEDSILIIINNNEAINWPVQVPIINAVGIYDFNCIKKPFQIKGQKTNPEYGQYFVSENQFKAISKNLPYHLNNGLINYNWFLNDIYNFDKSKTHAYNSMLILHQLDHYSYCIKHINKNDLNYDNALINALIQLGQIKDFPDLLNPKTNPLYYQTNIINNLSDDIQNSLKINPDFEIVDNQQPTFKPETIKIYPQNFETLLKQTDLSQTNNIPIFIDQENLYNINDQNIIQLRGEWNGSIH